MKHPIIVVAKNTFTEMMRDRVLYFVVVFSVLFMSLCFALGQLSYDEIFRLSVSLGLSGIQICFAGLTIFLGGSLFYREIEKKTIYTLLVRPISRSQYLAGKYLGLVSVLVVMMIGFVIAFSVIQWTLGIPFLVTTYIPFLGILFESAILLSVTFCFSTFCKPFMTVTCSLAFFLIGHWVYNLDRLATLSRSDSYRLFTDVVKRIFPDLEGLNWRSYAVLKEVAPANEIALGLGGAVLWSLLFFLVAVYLFGRKDFE